MGLKSHRPLDWKVKEPRCRLVPGTLRPWAGNDPSLVSPWCASVDRIPLVKLDSSKQYSFFKSPRRRQSRLSPGVQRCPRSPRLPSLPPTRGQRRRPKRSGRLRGLRSQGPSLGDSPPGNQHPVCSQRLSLSLAQSLR